MHGYYLHDSGSASYVRDLTRALVRAGHDVILLCQERRPELYDFIGPVYDLDASNTSFVPPDGPRAVPGRCRLVRPNLGGRLLVYVEGRFPGFDASGIRAFQNAPDDWITGFIDANVAAARTTFAEWPPDLVLAQHTIMQPYIVNAALRGAAPYTVTVHGSELNFSIKSDPRMARYAINGLDEAAAVITVSHSSADELHEWSTSQGLDLDDKTWIVPPGIDSEAFATASSKQAAVEALYAGGPVPGDFPVSPDDDILATAGGLRWTKGMQHLIAALPAIAASRHRRVRLLVAGAGAGRGPLGELAGMLRRGDTAAARSLAEREPELASPPEFGPVVADVPDGAGDFRVGFLGHLDRVALAKVFAAADVSVAPSVFPEAVGLVNIEALSAGSLPLATYHGGAASVVDAVADSLADPAMRALSPGRDLTRGTARLVARVLESYPTADPAFRSRLHALAVSHFPTWDRVAECCVDLGTDATVGAPCARR